MNDTLQRVMRPYFMIAFFAGCGVYRHPNGYPRRCISIFYSALVWSVYAWCLYNVLITFTMTFPKSLFFFLNFFMLGVNVFTWMLSVFITFYKYKEQEMCIRQLDLINNTLEEFGISKEYDRIRKEIMWSLISWITLTCAINAVDTLESMYLNQYFMNSVIIAMITPWILEYSLHINTILDIIIVFILRYIGNRLDRINDCIIQLSETEDYGLRCVWKKSFVVSRHYGRDTEYCKRILWTTMHLHLELCHMARTINALYGMQMTVQMTAYFVVCTALAYFQYHTVLCLSYLCGSIKWLFISSMTLWIIFFLLKLLIINHICESVSAKAEKTKFILCRLTNLIRFADMYNEISQFGLQISLHPLRFSGMGLFYFGYKFIRSFTVWVFTIFLLLVQVDTFTFVLKISSKSNVTVCFE